MCASVKYVVFTSRLLNSRAQCLSIVNVRHYPRWTHRRPIAVIENNISRNEKVQWKLDVERTVNKKHDEYNSKVLSLKADGSDHKRFSSISEAFQGENEGSYSHSPIKRHHVLGDYVENTFNNAPSKYKETLTYDHEISPTTASKPDDSNTSIWNRRKLKGSFAGKGESLNRNTQQLKPIVKRKIYNSAEIERAIKLQNSADKLGVPVFTDLGDDDTTLSKYLTNVKSKKRREKTRQILLEGKRLIGDAIKAGSIPEVVFFTRMKDLKALNLPQKGIKVYKITYKKLCLWSDVVTSQGVLAILKTPDTSREQPSSLPLTVICDNIRDPGNMGAILRICAGVGCRKVILTKGCTDLWESKCIRAAAGAHFRLLIVHVEDWDEIRDEMSPDSSVFLAENNIASVGHGIESVRSGGNELNSGSETESDSDNMNLQMCGSKREDASNLVVAPVVPYYAFNYSTTSSVVLIVGGETEGVSFEAYKYISDFSGLRLNIPLSNDVESLNSGTALGVIAFEIKKQFLTKFSETDKENQHCRADIRIS